MSRAIARTSAALLAVLAFAVAVPAAERYDPRFRFRTTRTAHFDIHAHQGEEALARRLALIAESVRTKLEPVLGRPRGRVQVILVDQTSLSNGWATPYPYDTIEITAVPPAVEAIIGNTTDWLELVFTHEYTHILHLDRTRGFMQGVRRVFGRVPLAFPNAFVPAWQVEGLATFEESRMTGQGRVPAGDFRAIVDVAAKNGRFEPIDRAQGGLTDWPGGHAAYAYGAYFHQFLADRYGAERLSQLADATAGRIPFFGGGAFKNVFGKSAEDLWRDFQYAREQAAVVPSRTDAQATRLTRHGFTVTAPSVAGDGTIYYAISNPHGFPALMRLRNGRSSRVAWRALGNRTSTRGNWIVFDRLERARSVALLSDLYALRASDGDTRRLTKDARAGDPDLSPDGRAIVCTVQMAGRRALALVDFPAAGLAVPRVLVDDADADFGGPRWSPDGRRIVATRRYGGRFELVLVDPGTGAVTPLLARPDTRLATPSWTPDGSTVLFSAAPANEPFNVFSIDATSGAVRQVTDTRGGALFPQLSRSSLIYVGYTTDGQDLFSIRYDAAATTRSETADARLGSSGSSRLQPEETQNAAAAPAYSPLRTLVPTYWSPILFSDAGETVVGAGTAMSDALGRHSYAVNAGWAGGRGRPDWSASYAYDRWRPTIVASYADDTDPVRGGDVRSREFFAGVQVRFAKVRWSETIFAGFDAERDTLRCEGQCRVTSAERDLRSIRGGWRHDSRRQFGYSISTEEGFALESAVESSRVALGSDADAGAAVFDARAFTRLFGRHTVLAARAAGAASWGEVTARRVFSAAGPGPSSPSFDFDRDAIGLLRGFDPEDVLGTRVFAANLDLRFPLARPQRGPGMWPLFLHSLHGAAFLDAGHGWNSSFRATDIKTAVGAELSADVVVLHYLPLTITGGAAWTRNPTADHRRGSFFGRIGYAF